jgi:hypothetical protein
LEIKKELVFDEAIDKNGKYNDELEGIDFGRRFDIVTIDILYIIIQPSSFIGQETHVTLFQRLCRL